MGAADMGDGHGGVAAAAAWDGEHSQPISNVLMLFQAAATDLPEVHPPASTHNFGEEGRFGNGCNPFFRLPIFLFLPFSFICSVSPENAG